MPVVALDDLRELAALLATADPPELKGRGHRITQPGDPWKAAWMWGHLRRSVA